MDPHTFRDIAIEDDVRDALQQDDKTPKKLQEAERTELSIAAKVHNGKIVPLTHQESLIYTYLPTKVRGFRFPFLVNGSFLTNAGREELHDDRKWNEWLMEQAGEKILDWLALLAETQAYSDQVLLLLPAHSALGGKLAQHFYRTFQQHAQQVAFVPGRSGELLKPHETLVDRTGLSEAKFISPEAVVEYFNSTAQGNNLGAGSFIRSSVLNPGSLNGLGAHFFELDDLESFIASKVFQEHHTPEQNYDLIKYFHRKARNDREWEHRSRSIPFIYAEGDELRPPEALCFPTMEYENEFGAGVTVLHKVVYKAVEKDVVIREWLGTLGVKEPSDDAYLENEILGNIATCVTKENHLNVVRFLFEQHRKGRLTSSHYERLKGIKLGTSSGELCVASSSYLSNCYEPRLRLEQVYRDGRYVSEEYIRGRELTSDWKSFLLRIGVAESLSLLKERTNRGGWSTPIPYQYWNLVYEVAKERSQNYHPHLVTPANSVTLSRIQFSEHARNPTFAKLFWEQVMAEIQPYTIDQEAQLHWGYYGSTWPVPNYVPWSFKNEAIFPTTAGECLLASDVFANHAEIKEVVEGVLPVFDCPLPITQDWLELIPFKTTLGLDDLLAVLEHMSNQPWSEIKDREHHDHRLGLVYGKLAKELERYSATERTRLETWGTSNKLLAKGGEYVVPRELYWIKSSMRISDGRTRTLHVPDSCRNVSGFEELLHILGVKVIDRFTLRAEDNREDDALKQRLKALMPFMALVASVRQDEELDKVLDRLSKRADGLKLYQCSALSLVFKVDGEDVHGEPMRCYRDGSSIHYTGSWSGKSIVYELVPELAKALGIPKLHMDLMRLLHSDPNEIAAFMEELGADVSVLPDEVRKVSHDALQQVVSIGSISERVEQDTEIARLLAEKNISLEQLRRLIEGIDSEDHGEDRLPGTVADLPKKDMEEHSIEARKLVRTKLESEGYRFTKGIGEHSLVNGVVKDDVEYPLVVKSYKNASSKLSINPNEWIQLSKPNAMFWVHRGNGRLEVLDLNGLLSSNAGFHVQFETATFGFDGLVRFAEAFRFVRNVRFQLDAPNFRMADALDEYRFNSRTDVKLTKGDDNDDLLG
ncbi:MAG TPA: hypothetical protein PKD45_08150 [Flavobacteriales bacterium]|nr:hypothetical protein [Flavobacteriales bacterium]